ncbi:MAG: MATE family efflux transporter [Lachnospiraceae bacterium]|nr:MATE family efflux transporter [Lachnospiraceae bacterium]
MSRLKDMTEGRPLRLMIRFSGPLLLSNTLQLLFTVVDSAMLGRILGVNSFASVGATASLHWFALSFVLGMCHGFGTFFAQRFGAKDMEGLRRAFITAAYVALFFGVATGISGIFTSRSLLLLLNTPTSLIPEALIYLRFLLGGLPLTFAYNVLSITLYSLGDSKTPLRAMVIATVANIILNLALIFPFGVAGVAAASLLAQALAFAYCFFTLRNTGILKGCGRKPQSSYFAPLLRLALPLAFRNAVIEMGGLLLQRSINAYGVEFVAGMAAARRMYSLLMIAGGAVEASIVTFVAQNYGAKLLGRVKQGVLDGLRLALISTSVIMVIALLFGRQILGLLIDGDPAQILAVLDVGTRQLTMMTLFLPFLYLLFLFRGAIQGMGNTLIPMLSGFIELAVRVLSILLLTRIWGVWGIHFADPLAWPVALILLVISYIIIFKKLNNQNLFETR